MSSLGLYTRGGGLLPNCGLFSVIFKVINKRKMSNLLIEHSSGSVPRRYCVRIFYESVYVGLPNFTIEILKDFCPRFETILGDGFAKLSYTNNQLDLIHKGNTK